MSKQVIVIVAVVGVLAVSAGAFFGGSAYAEAKLMENPQALMAAMAESGEMPAMGRMGGMGGSNAGATNAAAPTTRGTIEEVGENELVLSTADGILKVAVTKTTMIEAPVAVGLADLEEGQTVSVAGSRNDDGSLTARSIQAMGTMQMKPAGGE